MSYQDYLKTNIVKASTKEDLKKVIGELRKISSNKKSLEVLDLINCALKKAEYLNDVESIIFLLDLKVRQFYHSKENLKIVDYLIGKIENLSQVISLNEGLCLAFQLKWHVEKLKGERERSLEAIQSAIRILKQKEINDEYTYYGCIYSYALESWFEQRNSESAQMLEECVNYFYINGFFHGLVMSLGILIIIYQQTQNKEKSMKLIKGILSNRNLLLKIPEEIQSIIHFFVGFSQELSFNLKEAETYLLVSRNFLKPTYKESVYSGCYLTALSFLTSTYALQGKLELALKQMIEVEKLIEEGIATKNLDSFSKRQITHTFNLTKFYVHSRLQAFRIEDEQNLVQIISDNIVKYHSNAMFFSEFLLNAELTQEQLIKIRNLNNPSTKRVEHIINFLIEKTTHTEEQQIMNWISALKRRPVEERMTFVEKAFADLLAAQEYYKINRFAEIYPLLKKYANNLHKIEVLEIRVFMEAFIQVGAYKNGDPLGPALQYMAIKKCRQHGFSRLENKLLDYLNIQGSETLKMLS